MSFAYCPTSATIKYVKYSQKEQMKAALLEAGFECVTWDSDKKHWIAISELPFTFQEIRSILNKAGIVKVYITSNITNN